MVNWQLFYATQCAQSTLVSLLSLIIRSLESHANGSQIIAFLAGIVAYIDARHYKLIGMG